MALCLGVGLNLLQLFFDFIGEEKRAERMIEQIIQSSLPMATDVVYRLDQQGAHELTHGLLTYDIIESCTLEDDNGTILAEATTTREKYSSTLWLTKLFFQETIERKVAITRDPSKFIYGRLIIRASNDKIYGEFYQRSLALFLSGLSRNLFLTIVLLSLFHLLLTRPLLKIASFFHSIQPESDQKIRLPLIPGHEFDEMGEIVNRANSFLENAEKHYHKVEEAHQEIAEKKEDLQNILMTTQEGFIRIDANAVVVETNPSMCSILGKKRYEIIGSPIVEFVDDKNREILAVQLQKRKEGYQSCYVIFVKNSEKGPIPCTVNATPVCDESGTFTGAFAFITDMSKAVAVEKEKNRLEKELFQARKMESIGTLAGGIAHEFNNLLAAIIGYTEFGLDELDKDSPVYDDMKVVLSSAQRGKELVRQILDFSRQSESEYAVTDAAAIVHEAIKILQSTLPANIVFKLNIDPTVGNIRVDPVKMQQVIINLCTNSYHAMEKTGGQLTVELTSASKKQIRAVINQLKLLENKYLRLTISDTGPGIPNELKERVFDPFFTTKEVGKGTGMGLSIVHGIIQDSKGWLDLESTEGKGCTIHVYLPLTDSALSVNRNSNVTGKEKDAVIAGQGETILVVDDEIVILNLYKKSLGKLGYNVISAKNGHEALTLFNESPQLFDIVLTDYSMPGMTGIELVHHIRQLDKVIPVIVVTGHSDSLSPTVLKQEEVNGFAYKPIKEEELAGMLRKVLVGENVFSK